MPSRLHEDLLRLFQNRPVLAAELAREALHATLPEFSEAHADSANLSDLRPTEYRADLVVLLRRKDVVYGIVVEVQLTRDQSKEYTWPAYVCNLRGRIRCPVCLLVMTVDPDVTRWAARSIDLGGDNFFKPWVLDLGGVPEVTDEKKAKEDPELAVLSVMAHGRDSDVEKAAKIALAAEAAFLDLDTDRSTLYRDMLDQALSEAARKALLYMNPAKYEYRGEFAKRYYGQGLAEGRAELVLRQLSLRFGTVPEEAQAKVRSARIEELDRIGERLLTAGSLDEALAA